MASKQKNQWLNCPARDSRRLAGSNEIQPEPDVSMHARFITWIMTCTYKRLTTHKGGLETTQPAYAEAPPEPPQDPDSDPNGLKKRNGNETIQKRRQLRRGTPAIHY